MDKKGYIREHSKVKLTIYEKYLERYLSVLTNTKYFKTINIWEPFAGSGVDKNGVNGSALRSAAIIQKFLNKKHLKLFLNELDEDNYWSLEQHIKDNNFSDFTFIFNEQAETFLKRVTKTLNNNVYGSHNFFFLDPFGYTQYTKENLHALLNLPSSEYLIFFPTSSVYRFLRANIKNRQ